MITHYDTIADQYRRSKQLAWRKHIESYTLFGLIGDPAGKAVLDLACGEGFYTRLLKKKGAARVVGADLSDGMIELARAEEARNPLGLEYHVADAKELALGERFDLVVAGYLLNYARSRDELCAMCRAVARHLRPGGRFVTVNNNPEQPPRFFPADRKYGFVKSLDGELREGAAIHYRFFVGDESFEFDNYYLSRATHEAALRSAGLYHIRWHGPELSPEGLDDFGVDYWSDFLFHPAVIFLECSR